MYTLPLNPSQLLELSLNDAQSLDRDIYYPDARYFHRQVLNPIVEMQGLEQPPEHICRVCLAGAVMVRSLDAPYGVDTTPSEFPGLAEQLHALDFMRKEDWDAAFDCLHIPEDLLPDMSPVACVYFRGWHEFDMHVISQRENVRILRAAGL